MMETLTTILLSMLSSGLVTVLVTRLLNRKKMHAEVTQLETETGIQLSNYWRNEAGQMKKRIRELENENTKLKRDVGHLTRENKILMDRLRELEKLIKNNSYQTHRN